MPIENIPDFQTLMLPLLKLVEQGEKSIRVLTEELSVKFNLTEEERAIRLSSSPQTMISNRVGWARTYLRKANLVDILRRGVVAITARGIQVLAEAPNRIDIAFLNRYPEFVEFRHRSADVIDGAAGEELSDLNTENQLTPDELMQLGFIDISESLRQELLSTVRAVDPTFFEYIVKALLEKMGYGQGEVTGGSGDGGIDGVIYRDPLRLEKVFFQAKRFGENTPVTQSQIRDFIGSLTMHGVNNGVFITTSRFPADAAEAIVRSHKSIRLIDGVELVELMITYNLGVEIVKVYEIKRLNTDFFQSSEDD